MKQNTVQILDAVLNWWLLMAKIMHRMCIMMCVVLAHRRRRSHMRHISYSNDFHKKRVHLRNMIHSSDAMCYNQIRMYRSTFDCLCSMIENIGGLKPSKDFLVDEQVAMFLHILAHHTKNRVIQFEFGRSGETTNRYFYMVLNAMMRLHGQLLKVPKPIGENSTNEKWKWFKNCLGALDGMHISIKVPAQNQARYRNRRGQITTNVLAVCSPDGQFVYVFPGWEGSAVDGRVLQDAISRVNGGLKVPRGYYYLVDYGFKNCEGFLAPYRGQRYHLNEWRDGYQPNNPREYFNMKHSGARNVIERCSDILKNRWSILQSPPSYHARTHNRVIMACCMLHNLIKKYNVEEPYDDGMDEDDEEVEPIDENNPILTLETSNAWSNWRDALATEMFNELERGRGSF